jgi:uncharacterized protein YpuA (DUF1002 family)
LTLVALPGIYKTFDVSKSVAINPSSFDVSREEQVFLSAAAMGCDVHGDFHVSLWLFNIAMGNGP